MTHLCIIQTPVEQSTGKLPPASQTARVIFGFNACAAHELVSDSSRQAQNRKQPCEQQISYDIAMQWTFYITHRVHGDPLALRGIRAQCVVLLLLPCLEHKLRALDRAPVCKPASTADKQTLQSRKQHTVDAMLTMTGAQPHTSPSLAPAQL